MRRGDGPFRQGEDSSAHVRMEGLPAVAASVLWRTLPSDWRSDILRDIEEAYVERKAVRPRAAWLWLLLQVVVFSLRFLPIRLGDLLSGLSVSSLDLRLALRSIRRHWGLSVLTVVALSLGIGTAAGAFGLIDGAFFSELPFADAERIYLVEDYNATRSTGLWVSGDEYVRRRDALTSFEYLGAYYSRGVVLGSERRVTARFMTPELLELTGVAPLMGRLPEASDAVLGAEPVVLLPHDLWTAALGGDPGVVGSLLEIAGEDRTVIGVMPPGFAFPYGDEIWIPIDARATTERFRMIGKLREGVEVAAARAELAVVGRQDPSQVQSPDDVINVLVTRLNRPVTGNDQLVVLAAPLLALVLLLVVMATNVATVVLARNEARSGELAVRVALGASRGRVVGQLVLEVAVTVLIAAAAGLALAQWALAIFEARVRGLPFWVDFSLDPLTVAFTIGLAGLATVIAGLVPALRTTTGSLQDSLKDGGRGMSALRFGRTTDAIIVAELGISVGFLAAAAILGQSLLSFGFARYDLPAGETLVAQVYFGQPEAFGEPDVLFNAAERERIWGTFLEQATRERDLIVDLAGQFPGVRMVAVASRFPGDESETVRIEVEGAPSNGFRTVEFADVGAGYFELLGTRPMQGRDFTSAEYAEALPVALVDQPFVDEHFGGGSAVGRLVRVIPDGTDDPRAVPWVEIVGVVPDLGLSVGDPSRTGTIYQPIEATNILWLGLRGDGDPNRWTPALIEAVREIDTDLRVSGSQTLERLMMLPVNLYRGLGVGFLVLGGIALLLSAASLHAVTASAVTRRIREFGIRRALGAPAGALVLSAVRRAGLQLGAGALLGIVLGYGLLRLATIFPWRLGAGNPLILGLVPAVLGLAVLGALAGPLMRALSVRPADALRHE